MSEEINVDKDIKLAETLPAKFYKDKNIFELIIRQMHRYI